MKLNIPKDRLLNPMPPRIFLCNTARKKIGQLPATEINLDAKWRQYSELSFKIQRTYVDLIDGVTRAHPLYEKVEAPRNVFVEDYGLFCLQDIDDTSNDSDIKSVSAFSLEYATSNKYLTNFRINTGEVDSKEVLFNEKEFGIDYNTDRDSFYTFASGDFKPFESYYQRQYTDKDSYTYERVEITNKEEYDAKIDISNKENAQLSEKLYVKKFPNVQFFNNDDERHGLSLLHLVFENIPEWQLHNVDQSLWHKERQFSEDRISVYDFLMNKVSETFGCTFIWNSLDGTVDVVAEVEDDEMENEASTRFETDVFISKSNLASECQVKYSSDNIKTKLVVTGADDLDIREVNLGRNEIMDLGFYHTEDWMEPDLFQKYSEYLEEIKEAQTGLTSTGVASAKYPISYPDAVQGWVSANNRYHELMHAVPSEENVLLVGDEFEKLFCAYAPIDSAYVKDIIINSGTSSITTLYYDKQCTVPVINMKDGTTHIVQGFKLIYSLAAPSHWKVGDNMLLNSKAALIKKLNQYHVDEDTQANNPDNILLRLRNAASDVATIRIYDAKAIVPSDAVIEKHLNYYTKNSDNTYKKKKIESVDEFKNGSIYTNNYMIQSIVVKASGNVSEAEKTYTLDQWLAGELTAEMNGSKGMNLEGYTVSHIGVMGAYFVLAKDEIIVKDDGVLQVSQSYLDSCGVNLLKEKHAVYTTLFQSQTEAMFSQEKYQCIVQDSPPEGEYKEGTRWLDSDDESATLYEYKNATSTSDAGWQILISVDTQEPVSPTDDELRNYENYQRYLDNFNKLKAVQKTLVAKERHATYCLDGYKVDVPIVINNTSAVQESIERVIETHLAQFGENQTYSIQRRVNEPWILYTFIAPSYDPFKYALNTKSYNSIEQYYLKPNPNIEEYEPIAIVDQKDFDERNGTLYVATGGHIYAVYLKDNVPYISYENSQGVYQMIRDNIREQTEMSEFFKDGDMWIRLSPFIKEDEYNDSNYLLTGYESEEERISIAEELMESAAKKLKSLCKPSLEFSMTMGNILALPEFASLVEHFQLGNFIKVEIRDGYIKRSRLLEANINFDDISSFSATFGNLVSVKSEVDRHAELLSQAVTAGKTVAKSKSTWQKTTEKANKLETDIANGLKDMALAIGSASGQAISWDHTGMHFRKYKEGSTTEYEPEEIAIINNSLVATNDSWLTSKAAFGKYTIDGEERWGPIAEYVTADKIEGKIISGGSLHIGGGENSKGEFIVTEDGEVIIRGEDNQEKYAAKEFEKALSFQVMLIYEGTTVFFDREKDFCKITCEVYHNGTPITDKILSQSDSKFEWIHSIKTNWTPEYALKDGKPIPNQIIVRHDHIDRNSHIKCSVEFDETEFETGNNTTTEGGASE